MCCITNVTFNVLINGVASPFFHSKRGLRKGCPLSPLLFLLIMEGLSSLIKEEHRRGRLRGIPIIEGCTLTHFLFVDDVLLFLNGSIGDVTTVLNSFTIFLAATGMMVNNEKSIITAIGCSPYEIQYALRRFPYNLQHLDEGLKCLGYRLKPLGYKNVDWVWLITKMEKRLNIWYLKYLS